MKILITGGKGMLGRTLQKELSQYEIIIADLPECDITNAEKFNSFLKKSSADVVIHCAAMTAVDKCETEVELAYKLNVIGTLNVASACHRNNVRLIAISTDYVFGGDLHRAYNEFDKAGDANTIYGKTKFEGEELIRRHCPNHVIARISWLYGTGGPSFVHAMLNLADGSRDELKVVDDQVGNPTSAKAVAKQLLNIIQKEELVGTFHMTCEGGASWFEFAKEIFSLTKNNQKIKPCKTNEFPRPAPRPANSRLDKMMLRLYDLPPMPNWKDALKEFIEEEF